MNKVPSWELLFSRRRQATGACKQGHICARSANKGVSHTLEHGRYAIIGGSNVQTPFVARPPGPAQASTFAAVRLAGGLGVQAGRRDLMNERSESRGGRQEGKPPAGSAISPAWPGPGGAAIRGRGHGGSLVRGLAGGSRG